ncbi:MAG: hypothetical protein GW911_25860 [Armatimonadetes bacterium]|nr:hypothetical protein [Armatimonadota bacterium]
MNCIAPAVCSLLFVTSMAWSAPAPGFTSSFEPTDPPTAWNVADNGVSTPSAGQAHTGKRSLKIADPDDQTGSNARSARIAVEPGKECLVSVWTFLESGDPQGLGVYLDLLGADGKRLDEASERSSQRPTMQQGKWTRLLFTVAPPAEAEQAGLWLHTFSTATVTCFVDDVELKLVEPGALGPAAAWQGGTLEDQGRKVWPFALRWEHGQSASLSLPFAEPQDWSRYAGVRFWVHSQAATSSTFMVIFNSENDASEGIDYFSFKVVLDFEGWKEFVLPFHELGRSREPVGWNKVDSITLTASGWGQTVNPETVVTLDGFEPVDKAQAGVGGLPSDEAFFTSLDLDLPGMAEVKQAVAARDMARAREALAKHLRDRTSPKWLFDWHDAPLRGVRVPGPEADKAPDQWDYYSTFLTLDWEGWKHFSLKKADFAGEAFVEGAGWKGKRPIGWNWIQYIALYASGWGLTPDPNAVLYFDDLRLVGKGKSKVIGDFETESNWSGLDQSPEQAKEGKASGKWGNQVRTTGIKCTDLPHDWTDYDTLDFWLYSAKATGSKVVMVLDSDVPKEVAAAEKILKHQFDYTQGPGKTGTLDFGPKIDWTANPTSGEARTHLWNESINRHFHFRTLAQAYWNTGQDKYAKEIAEEILAWTDARPRPLLSSGNNVGHYAWQTLTTGIRLADTWPEALYRCLGSESLTPEVLTAMMKSAGEQARHLVKWPSSGNWLTAESNGLFTAGMLFPEFKEAKGWRQTAVERLYKQLDDEVYPDGMEYEVAAGYNNWVVSEFSHILELADLNDLRPELPADYQAKIEKMYNYQLFASMPNGAIPGFNDSGNANVRGALATGFKLFPNREDFQFVATARAQGKQPDHTSHAFPWTGHYVMRSGWDEDATFLAFDAGPYGYGHQHEDKLSFVVWAHGRQQLLDPGNFSYDQSRWRRYVLATYGHNTVLVDGQGQHRNGKRETYFWPRPWQGAAPPDNDARWTSTPDYDFASGVYSDGYGPKNEIQVAHTRRVLYLKADNLFVLFDQLVPADPNDHTYQALFHLDTEEATAGPGTAVTTQNPDQSNLTITPAGNLDVEIVKGKTEEPVQGWSNGPWRAIPTAIYSTKGSGPTRLAFVLEPVVKGAPAKVSRVEVLPGIAAGVALRLTLTDGSTRLIVQRDKPGEPVTIEGVTAKTEMTVVSRGGDGKTVSQFAFDGEAQ